MLTRSVLITGCSRGLGLEIVRQLVTSEDPPEIVIATCRNPDAAKELQTLAAQYRMLKIIKFDVVAYDDLARVVGEIGALVGPAGLSLLINNAAIVESCPTQERGVSLSHLTPDMVNSVLNTNVTAPLMLVKALLPLLRAAAAGGGEMGVKRAAVVNMSSNLSSMADYVPLPDVYAYRTSKAALNMVTKELSMEFGPEGVLVVAVHPGWVQTDMGTAAAPLTAQQSITHVLAILPKLTKVQGGLLVSYDGSIINW